MCADNVLIKRVLIKSALADTGLTAMTLAKLGPPPAPGSRLDRQQRLNHHRFP
jgi:hypothetical protein